MHTNVIDDVVDFAILSQYVNAILPNDSTDRAGRLRACR
jgi:hypothetical protein